MPGQFEYEIIERIAVLYDSGTGHTIELNRVSYNGYPAKLDLRKWHNEQPLKGIMLTADEGRSLLEGLKKAGLAEPDPDPEV